MASRLVTGVLMAAFTITLAGCGGPDTTEVAEAPAADASHEGHTGGRAYFVAPKDGETVTSPVRFEFGVDQYEIAAVPQGQVTDVRAGMGHFHLGVDTDCLPAGTEIPKAEAGATTTNAGSWIHFGTGTRTIDMSLTPGEHKLSVQVGDDLHRAVEGLCETITVTVK